MLNTVAVVSNLPFYPVPTFLPPPPSSHYPLSAMTRLDLVRSGISDRRARRNQPVGVEGWRGDVGFGGFVTEGRNFLLWDLEDEIYLNPNY